MKRITRKWRVPDRLVDFQTPAFNSTAFNGEPRFGTEPQYSRFYDL